MRNSRGIVLAVLILGAGCSRAPQITISNLSDVTLSNVLVSGSGFSERIGNIAPRADFKLTVHPVGDSGIRVAFDASGQHIDSGEQDYIEPSGGYRASVVVGPDLKVSASSKL